MEAMEIRALEEMAANAHVALNMMQYDGWLLRFSAGHTNRANSVSVLYPSTINIDEKIGYCEQQYRAQGLPCVFKLTDADGELGALLEKRGYGIVTPTDVMILDLPEMEMPEGRSPSLTGRRRNGSALILTSKGSPIRPGRIYSAGCWKRCGSGPAMRP